MLPSCFFHSPLLYLYLFSIFEVNFICKLLSTLNVFVGWSNGVKLYAIYPRMLKRNIFLVSEDHVERHVKYHIIYLRVSRKITPVYDIVEMEGP